MNDRSHQAGSIPRAGRLHHWLSRLTTTLMLLLLATPAVAEDSNDSGLPDVPGFPDGPIRIVVYTSPGGLIDLTARRFADIARKYHTEHPFVVINRPGGGGIVAFENVLSQPADGHNILAVTRSNISKMVAIGREDLIERTDWHSYIMDNPHVLITNVTEGFADWEAMYADAQERAGDQLWLGVDIGGVKHISGVKMADFAGINMRWIPYSSGGEAAAALIGNLGHAYLGNPRDALASDRLDIAVVAASERMALFPEAPTFTELGIEGLEGELIWRGLALREGTPEPIREWWRALAQKVASDPDWIRAWEREGVNLTYRGAEEFNDIVRRDREEFSLYLREIGLIDDRERERTLLERAGDPPGVYWLIAALVLLNGALAGGMRYSRFRNVTTEMLVLTGLLSLSLLFYVMAAPLPPPSEQDPISARGIPRLWALALVPMLLYLIWRLTTHGDTTQERHSVLGLFGFVGVMTAYLIVLPWSGYLLASLFYMPAAMWMLGYRRPITIAVLTASWLVFAEVVFRGVLHVDLPTGRLFS